MNMEFTEYADAIVLFDTLVSILILTWYKLIYNLIDTNKLNFW
jgi:hypothetical protein